MTPNCIGANVLDSALVDPGRAWDRIGQVDMAAVTVLDASHPAQAMAFAQRLRRERPETLVVYRRYREDLPDATLWQRVTPAQFVELFRPALEIGCYAATHCEAAPEDLTQLADFEADVLEMTAAKGWRLGVFKMSTGSPSGYKGEQPDHYAAFDRLWRLMAEVNRPMADANQFPLALALPHAYFQQDGLGGGMLDRHPEIHRRAIDLKINPWLIPIHIGEAAALWEPRPGVFDANAGYKDPRLQLDSISYAHMTYQVIKAHWLKGGHVPHLWSLGESVGGWMSRTFDLLHDDDYWEALAGLAADGSLSLKAGYGHPAPEPEATNSWRGYFLARSIPARLSGENLRVRNSPGTEYTINAIIPPEGVNGFVVSNLDSVDQHHDVVNSVHGTWLPVFLDSGERGWVFGPFLRVAPLVDDPPPADERVAVQVPPLKLDRQSAVMVADWMVDAANEILRTVGPR
jgi:hypothetical protein